MTRYHTANGAQHRREVRSAPRGTVPPSIVPDPGAPPRPARRHRVPGRRVAPDGDTRGSCLAVRATAGRLALHHADADAPTGDGSTAPSRLDDLVALDAAGPIERRSGAVAPLRSASATSAGGIVVRNEGDRPSLVAGLRRREGDRHGGTWTLPKGTPNPGESVEETAIREVEEETGLKVRIVSPLPSIEYTFVQGGTRIHKTVHYFLMEPVGGGFDRHDHEFERVRWVRFEDARSLLTFDTERALVETAANALRAPGGPAPLPTLGTEASAG
ncbi:MAG: NUDIX hydrolase [Chloroflexota bacterium]|nr:MAG: NUDIX hydrolase [Chloroflexota bacterium]